MKSFGNIILVLASCANSSKVLTAVEKALSSSELPSVPEVENPDKNGFPTMRPIESVMEGFTHERDRLNHEAAVLGLSLKKLEKDDADRVAQQNEVDLEKLKEQEKKNQAVAVENAKVAKLVMDVRKGNDKLSALVHKEGKLVQLRRDQFAALKKKFLEGQERVNDLLKGSDPSTEVALLQMEDETRRKEDQQEEGEEERPPTSFLEIPHSLSEVLAVVSFEHREKPHSKSGLKAAQTHPHEQIANATLSMPYAGKKETAPQESTEIASSELEAAAGFDGQAQEPVIEAAPQSFGSGQTGLTELESDTGTQISSLAKQASKLSKAAHHSLAELNASFEEAYKAGAKRHTALMEQQSALKASLKSAEEQFAQLRATYKRVTSVRQGLERELQKNGALLGEVQKMEAVQMSSHPF